MKRVFDAIIITVEDDHHYNFATYCKGWKRPVKTGSFMVIRSMCECKDCEAVNELRGYQYDPKHLCSSEIAILQHDENGYVLTVSQENGKILESLKTKLIILSV